MLLFTFVHFFPVRSLLNKPTVPENGTHHTAAVKKSAAKKTPPRPKIPPPLSVPWIPDAELAPHLYRVSGSASDLDRGP